MVRSLFEDASRRAVLSYASTRTLLQEDAESTRIFGIGIGAFSVIILW